MSFKIVHLPSGRVLAQHARMATSIRDRLFGLLGSACLPCGQGLILKPCSSIHTFGMRYAIDVLVLDKQDQVLAFYCNLAPNRMTRTYLRALSVVELPAGSLQEVKVGDPLSIV